MKAVHIKTRGPGIGVQVLTRIRLLVGKEQISIFPELSLLSGALSCHRSSTSARMDLLSESRIAVTIQRIVVKDEADIAGILSQELCEYSTSMRALRTPEVGELRDRQHCLGGS